MESGAGGGVSAVAALTMDCEDMFKEITKKLYGEETSVGVGIGSVVGVEFPAAERDLEDELRPEEHITAWGLAALMQNGFPPPGILQANFSPRLDPTAEDRWTAAEEPLAWAHSRVASYNGAQRLFKCCECECVGFLARIAEHWLGTHSAARVFHCPAAACPFASSWARAVRVHLQRDHHSDPAHADHLLRDNPALDDLTRYLQRLKNKVEASRNDRRTGGGMDVDTAGTEGVSGTGAVGAAGSGAGVAGSGEGGKRYACAACPYATDRRDLFTRHENIHRDEKPFHCYLCQKQFNRADHVKKHFLRMHRDQPYDLNRIRRMSSKLSIGANTSVVGSGGGGGGGGPGAGVGVGGTSGPVPAVSVIGVQHHYYTKPPVETPPATTTVLPLEYRVQPVVKVERPTILKTDLPTPTAPAHHKAVTTTSGGGGGGGAAASGTGSGAGVVTARRKGERRYACCYCSWSGVDNWCLKRHLNTHLKPFACSLCEYKAARAERLATHVHKVHNKKACAKCPFLADDQLQLAHHLREAHHIESRNLKVPSGMRTAVSGGFAGSGDGGDNIVTITGAGAAVGGGRRGREGRAAGAARLFGYLEASDGSGDEFESGGSTGTGGAPSQLAGDFGSSPTTGSGQFARDKENAAPPPPQPPSSLHHTHAHQLHHDHCLRY